MRKLIYFVMLCSALYGGYWFVGAIALEAGLGRWLMDQGNGQNGVVVSFTKLTTRGFPNRFDTIITDLDLRDPSSSNGWSIPVMRIHALSYRPNHIIAAWPNSQQLTLAGETITIDSDEMKGSVVFRAETALSLERSSFVISNLVIDSNNWRAGLDSGSLATRQTVAKGGFHDLAIKAKGITPTREASDLIDPERHLPAKIDALIIDATLGFDAPWNRFSFNNPPPRLTELNLKHLTLSWGSIDIRVSGILTVGDDGYPEGTLDITASDWPKMYRIALSAGLIDPDYAAAVESGLKALATTSGDSRTIETSLTFSDKEMFLGLLLLGSAPRLD